MTNRTVLILVTVAALAAAAVVLALGNIAGRAPTDPVNEELLQRVSVLEAELKAEREAREQWLSGLTLRKDSHASQQASEQVKDAGLTKDEVEAPPALDQIAAIADTDRFEDTEGSQSDTRRMNRKRALIAGGFDESQANWILDNEAQVQLDELFDQHRIRRAAIAEQTTERNLWFNRKTRQDRLRVKLGDESFEQYLKANGWPTSARVQNVIQGSPAALAGLKDGDNIVSYAGERVFNLRDVNRLTLQGNEGESVLIEVEREGSRVQVTLPRGPIGVSGG